jgi:hypothetical protein
MSKCHFPQDNYTIILDVPSITNFNNSLRLIETHNYICHNSLPSFACLDKHEHDNPTYDLLQEDA